MCRIINPVKVCFSDELCLEPYSVYSLINVESIQREDHLNGFNACYYESGATAFKGGVQ